LALGPERELAVVSVSVLVLESVSELVASAWVM
jgi:hypothetical protein